MIDPLMNQLHGKQFIIESFHLKISESIFYVYIYIKKLLYLKIIFGCMKIPRRKGPLAHLLCLKENEKGFSCYLLEGKKYLLSRTLSLVSKGKRKG